MCTVMFSTPKNQQVKVSRPIKGVVFFALIAEGFKFQMYVKTWKLRKKLSYVCNQLLSVSLLKIIRERTILAPNNNVTA